MLATLVDCTGAFWLRRVRFVTRSRATFRYLVRVDYAVVDSRPNKSNFLNFLNFFPGCSIVHVVRYMLGDIDHVKHDSCAVRLEAEGKGTTSTSMTILFRLYQSL